jgi:hypothetical protein
MLSARPALLARNDIGGGSSKGVRPLVAEGVKPFATRHLDNAPRDASIRIASHPGYSLLAIAVKIDCSVNDAFDRIASESRVDANV